MSLSQKCLLFLGTALISLNINAQTVSDAGALYNEGNSYYKEKDYSDAITAYEDAMEIANLVGGDAEELKERIQTNLLKAYYGNATAFYKQGFMRWFVNFRNISDTKYEMRGFGGYSVIPAAPFAVYGGVDISL